MFSYKKDKSEDLEKTSVAGSSGVVSAVELGLSSVDFGGVLGDSGESGQGDDDSVLGSSSVDGIVVIHLGSPDFRGILGDVGVQGEDLRDGTGGGSLGGHVSGAGSGDLSSLLGRGLEGGVREVIVRVVVPASRDLGGNGDHQEQRGNLNSPRWSVLERLGTFKKLQKLTKNFILDRIDKSRARRGVTRLSTE